MSYLTCVKQGSLELFDRLTTADVIPLTQRLRLTRYRDNDIGTEETNDVKRITSKRYYVCGGGEDLKTDAFECFISLRFKFVFEEISRYRFE